MQVKTAIHPDVADVIKYGVGGAGIGALLAAITAASPKLIKSEFTPRSASKVVPKRILPQPVYVDDDMADRLSRRGVTVHQGKMLRPAVEGDEQSGIDPMQKVADDILESIAGGAKKLAPWAVGATAMGGAYLGVNKMIARRAKQQAKEKYIAKRRQLNALLAGLNDAGGGNLQKIAALEDVLPWLIGVPFLAGGAMSFNDGKDSAIAANKNIKAVEDLDRFYADLPDTPKLQLTPVRRPNPKKKRTAAHDALRKVAGFRLPQMPKIGPAISKTFSETGRSNDILSLLGAGAAAAPAWALSQNIDDPSYKWMERGLMPLSVGMLLNRRLNNKGLKPTVWTGLGTEAGIFGGLRALDAGTNRLPKALEAQAAATREAAADDRAANKERIAGDAANNASQSAMLDKVLKWGTGGGAALGALLLGSQYMGDKAQMREATRGRRAQSRQLKKILSTVQGHDTSRSGDLDGDGDVDDDDRALAAAAGVTAAPIPSRSQRVVRH